jgi:hypothetical protein
MGRNTQGVRLVNLKSNDRLVGLETVSESDLEQYAARSGAEGLEGVAASEAKSPPVEPKEGAEDVEEEKA